MVKLNTVIRYLNSMLSPRSINDTSRNGLQFRGKDNVRKAAFAVDACIETFKKAAEQKCDLIIVHHGIYWKGAKKDSITRNREMFLKKHNLSLYACHLPLDKHKIYGNNIKLAELLDLKNIKEFGSYNGTEIGFSGQTDKTLKQIKSLLDKKLVTKAKIYNFSGLKNPKSIALVSGGGSAAISEAISKRIRCFITGEVPHHIYHIAKESRIDLVIAGHYASETLGVKALSELLKEKFNIATKFIDVPTGL